MRSYLIILVLFTISFNVLKADFGLAVLSFSESIYSPAYACIAENFNKTVIRINDYQNFVDSFINLRNANFTAEIDAYMDLYTDQSDVFAYCTTIAESLPNTFNGTVWLEPQVSNLTNVENIVVACKQQGLNMGIYSSSREWEGDFGNLTVSSPILSQLPLWYEGSTNNTDFSDYTDFGGWTKPTMKDMSGSGVACNSWSDFSYGYHLFYY